MNGILLLLTLSVVIEGLIQYGKNIYDWFAGGNAKTAITQLCAMTISILLCLATGADIFKAIGIYFYWPVLGVVLTGIFASRGSNYVSDFIKKLELSNRGKSE
ncbi:MAG TPA: hypothetical protein GXX17_05420 [Clostridiales bacterium]|nr:hypothetical protein [Clostridiales bacterium]